MSSLLLWGGVAAFSFLIFGIIPRRFRNTAGLIVLLSVDYLRQIGLYYEVISLSNVNYLSLAIYTAFIAHCIVIRKVIIRKITNTQLALVFLFWAGYFISSFYSIPFYNVEPNSVILLASKVIAFLFAVATMTSLNEIYICILLTIGVGGADLLLEWSGQVQSSVLLGSRELGFLPWLRMDTIWLSQAVLCAHIASRRGSRVQIHPSISVWRGTIGLVITLILSLIILYGIVTVQLRALAIESLIGLAIILSLPRISSLPKILGFSLVIAFVGAVFWFLLEPGLQLQALEGLIGRGDGGRLELWSYSIRVWRQSPIFGHGFGTDGVFLSQFMLPGRQGSHNVYLILATELGILGLAAWLYLNFKALQLEYALIQMPLRENERQKVLVFLILHLTMLFHVIFHGVIYFPWVIMLPAIPFVLFRKSAKSVQLQLRASPPAPIRTPS